MGDGVSRPRAIYTPEPEFSEEARKAKYQGVVVLVNPLVYVSEGMRAALTPDVPHMPAAAIFAALLVITAIFLYLGLRAFDKRAMS